MAAVFFASGAITFGPEGLLGSSPAATAVKMAHLLFFATSLGATVYAIFVGGIVMFLYLPRHMMGRLRGKVFPACFTLNTVCTALSAAAFAWLNYPWKTAPVVERRQLGLLVATVGFDLTNLLLLAPKTLEMMQERHIVERGLGLGEQGSFDGLRSNIRLATSNAALAAANRRFWAAHIPSAVALLASTFGLAAHLWYLAGKLAL
ncbi:transmembrane protein 205-like [Triticum dicoccoides]|uniref:transmembrane protein 205-like n=1 Tax=Triticum dicoccoides TaxID=85692 RepID=UPI00188EBC13|nr:transmembrane protein 205-like [Triticum dicoccoides]